MSRKTKRNLARQQASAAATAAASAQSAPPAGQPQAIGWSGYDGANPSTSRGRVNWWNLDTAKDLDSYSRQELVRNCRWLYANDGKLRGIIRRSADFIGWLTPKPRSSDREWNTEAYQWFEDHCLSKGAFDAAGKFDWWSMQLMLFRLAFRDGDALVVFTESANHLPMFAFYPGTQLANPKNAGEGWTDGIRISSQGRHIAYGIRSGTSGEVTIISADDAAYFGYFDDPQQPRPVPPLAHAINHALDRTEVRGFTKKMIKGAALSSVVRSRESNAPSGKDLSKGLPGPPGSRPAPGGGSYETIVIQDSGKVLDLNPGETIDVLHDARPSPNQTEFISSLVDDEVEGFGLPAYLLNDLSELTGPAIRFVMDSADRWAQINQGEMETLCRSMWHFIIAKAMKYGGLRRPKDGIWWRAGFSRMRNLTIDRGKELKGRMDACDAGYDTPENLCEEMFGTNADDVDEAHVQAIARRQQLCEDYGVEYDRAYPPKSGAAQTAPDPNAEDPAPAPSKKSNAKQS